MKSHYRGSQGFLKKRLALFWVNIIPFLLLDLVDHENPSHLSNPVQKNTTNVISIYSSQKASISNKSLVTK